MSLIYISKGEDRVNIKNIFIRIASVIFTALSICGICIMIYINEKDMISALILSLCMAASFIFISFFANSFSKKVRDIIFIIISFIIILGGIITAPYTPCHDALDLHSLLNYMLHNNNTMPSGTYIRAYMNFFVNNKLVIYMYLPFVHLFKNTMIGVRFLNGALLIGSVFFTAGAVTKIIKKDCFSQMFLILSMLSPIILLLGPYIYLPSIFIASASMYCYEGKGTVSKIFFFVSASALFALRPTCFGFLITFITLDVFFRFEDKKELIKKAVSVALTVIFAFVFKTALGTVFYKTGLHIYPNMENAAGLWTMELGTRTNGEQTGTCFYTPFNPKEEADDIQRDFFKLWEYYHDDAELNTDNYNNIVNLQNSIRQKLINRTFSRTPAQFYEHLYLKTVTFFKNLYMPYYYKANVNDENMKIWKDYDKKYFSYMNMLFILFFLSSIINFIRIMLKKDGTNGTAAALGISALAVNIVFLLLTEVQKKYMFDFYVPMSMCIAMLFSFDTEKKIKMPIAALITAALVFAFGLNETMYDIKILKGAKTSLVKNDNETTFTVKMKEVCKEQYFIYNNRDNSEMHLIGKDEFSITFPEGSFDAFMLCKDGKKVKDIKGFSDQKIPN